MEITSSLINHEGKELKVVYRDIDSIQELEDRSVKGVHAYCFSKDMLIVVYAAAKEYWAPPGGGVEKGETPEQAIIREVLEETNMKVLKHAFLGYQDIYESGGVVTQTRSVCLVEPYGDFISDPDGDITEMQLINPREYKTYFNWGVIGERLMERALTLKKKLEQ